MDALVAAHPAPVPLPRGPRTPRLWQSLQYSISPYATVASATRRWGERYTVAALGQPGDMVVFSDPDAVKDIFMGDGDDLRSGEATAPILGPILGWNSILLLDGVRHHRERRLMSPPFHGERRGLRPVMLEAADRRSTMAGLAAVPPPGDMQSTRST